MPIDSSEQPSDFVDSSSEEGDWSDGSGSTDSQVIDLQSDAEDYDAEEEHSEGGVDFGPEYNTDNDEIDGPLLTSDQRIFVLCMLKLLVAVVIHCNDL